MDKETAKIKIQELVEKYEKEKVGNNLRNYTEQDTKNGFIEPLFKALGWDVSNRNEVSLEDHIKGSGRSDYNFQINGITQFYLEAKNLKADLEDETFAKQVINYSWNKGVTYAILTDFESVKVFNAQRIDKTDLMDKKIFELSCDQYISDFDLLWLLSKDSFQKKALDEYAEKNGKKEKSIQVATVIKKINEDVQWCRERLTESFRACNEKLNLSQELIDEGVQKLLDRLIFLRVAEDRDVEPHILKDLLRQAENSKTDDLFQAMVSTFRDLDHIYDSNLFSEHAFEKWEVWDGGFKEVVNKLYGKKGYYEYNFKEMPADVLGSVYESYLGYKLSTINSKNKKLFGDGKEIVVSKDAKKRKEQGIFYTPTFVVDYIVRNALKPVLDNCKSVADLKKIKVLDPACGSGSFLIKALEAISKRYHEFGVDNHFLKRQIILENIFGVDLDMQAVEIARLNLSINSLDSKGELPRFDKNIKNGNSLISGTDEEMEKQFGKNWRDKKPFNWQEEFSEVFKQGGFDVVIGNPPWGANIDNEGEYLKNVFPNSTKDKKDTYKIFIDKSLFLLKNSGILGFVVPNSFLYQPSYKDLKDLISQYHYSIINLGEHIFQKVELPCCIIILNKERQKEHVIIDLTRENRESLPTKIFLIDFQDTRDFIEKGKNIIKNTGLTFEEVFNLKDAGIQYHRSGIGLSNKGGNDLYERIFCSKDENKFDTGKETFYGKLLSRYYIDDTTDEIFNLDYKKVLNSNESVSFSKEAFNQDKKIIWRQTAATILAVLDEEKRWFRNTIQCAWIKEEYKSKFNIFYALAIFNSRYIDYFYRQKVLETGRVFPQVKIGYLRELPFVIGTDLQQKEITELVKTMLNLNKKLREVLENSNEWESIKNEIEKTNKKIDGEVYKLYDLGSEEIEIVENSSKKS